MSKSTKREREEEQANEDRIVSLAAERDLIDKLMPLYVLSREVQDHTALKPSALMLPLYLVPEATEVWGLEVVRGDRVALLYEAP